MFLSILESWRGTRVQTLGGIVGQSSHKLTLMEGMLDKRNTADQEGSRMHRLDGGLASPTKYLNTSGFPNWTSQLQVCRSITTCLCLWHVMGCKFAGTFLKNGKGLWEMFWLQQLLLSICMSFVTSINLHWVVPQCICSFHSAAAINDVIAQMTAHTT